MNNLPIQRPRAGSDPLVFDRNPPFPRFNNNNIIEPQVPPNVNNPPPNNAPLLEDNALQALLEAIQQQGQALQQLMQPAPVIPIAQPIEYPPGYADYQQRYNATSEALNPLTSNRKMIYST